MGLREGRERKTGRESVCVCALLLIGFFLIDGDHRVDFDEFVASLDLIGFG